MLAPTVALRPSSATRNKGTIASSSLLAENNQAAASNFNTRNQKDTTSANEFEFAANAANSIYKFRDDSTLI